MRKGINYLLIMVSLLYISACDKDKESGKNDSGSLKAGSLNFIDPWIRSSAGGMNTALFFEVANESDKPDTLFEVETAVSEISEIHETYQAGNDMLGMREVEFIELKPGETFQFKPKSYHIMLIKLLKDLIVSDTVEVTLFFKRTGKVTIKAPVRDMSMTKTMKH